MSESRYTGAAPALCPRCGARYEGAAKYCQRDGAHLVSGDTEADPYLGRELLGQFRIEEVIGSGGMGSVYRARQPSLDRDVAIKILHAELADDPDAVRRFQREARVATALDHPNVVRVLLLGQLDDGSLYLVMEHLSGRSLSEVAREAGPMPMERALHLGLQICDGVGEAHAHGVVHRDVKPENVMVVQRGRDRDVVKVLDFGIARLLWGEQTMATQSGVIFGTARYISPEGASGEPTDARSDVYSIAVVLYQLLAGETPFDGRSPVTLLLKHVNDRAPDIREKVQVADRVADVLMRGLSKEPGDRHADAAAFGAALRDAAARAGVVLPASGGGAAVGPSIAPRPGAGASFPPVAASPGPAGSPSLARAPSPFVETGGLTPAPPTRRPRLGPVATVMLAFLLGAGAVTAGALLVAWAMRGPAAETAARTAPSASEQGSEASGGESSDSPGGPGGAADSGAAAGEDEGVDVLAGGDGPSQPTRPAIEPSAEPAPSSERADRSAPAERRRRRTRPPVTTIRPGRSEPEPSEAPMIAPAVQEELDEVDAGASDPDDAPSPPPPWTGTLL